MRRDRIPMDSGDEQDVLTGWRKFYCWTQRAGAASKTKRRYRRRVRRHLQADLRDELMAWYDKAVADGHISVTSWRVEDGWSDETHDVMADMRRYLDAYEAGPRCIAPYCPPVEYHLIIIDDQPRKDPE